MTITWAQFVWIVGLFLLWNAFLVGIIKILISREVKAFENRLEGAEKRAGEAVGTANSAKQIMTNDMSALRLEVNQKLVCGNHNRMEDNDREMFKRLDNLHGDIRELSGVMKGVSRQYQLINEHLLNGGK